MHVTADDAGRYYAPEMIGARRSLTPEGYLVCYDVPIARTGEMYYAPGEIRGGSAEETPQPGPDGIIRVRRSPEDVFRTETMASFEGKAVTNAHPQDNLTASTWRKHASGTVQNVRRSGEEMLADLLVMDQELIDDINAGLREVSCGYGADYEEIEPGIYRQFNIIGNHVAVVPRGRCGPICTIGDSMTTPTKPRRTKRQRILTAFKAQDEAALEEEMQGIDDPSAEAPNGVHVHVHLPEREDETAKTEDEPEPSTEEPTAEADPMEARLSKIEAALTQLGEVVAKLAAAEQAETQQEMPAQDEESEEAKEDEPEPKDDDKGATQDSGHLAAEFQAALSMAEILAPGLTFPTFDSAACAKTTSNSICLLRRRALTKAWQDGVNKDVITSALNGRAPDFAGMTCDALFGVFTAAGNAVRARRKMQIPYAGKSSSTKVTTAEDLSKIYKQFWARP